MSKGKLRAIKKRIESTASTMQITRAMEMVARAKINKVQKGLGFIRLYEQSMNRALKKAYFGLETKPQTSGEGTLLLVVTSDMGLAGAFNSEILKLAETEMKKHPVRHVAAIGVKAETFFKTQSVTTTGYSHFYDIPDLDEAGIIADDIIDIMESKEIMELRMIYSNFRNAIAQLPKAERLLPIEKFEMDKRDVFDYEPGVEELYVDLLHSWVVSKILLGLYETRVGELYARQNAMKNATENAKNMIEKLTLVRNKLRQSNITQEIIEVVNGAEALNG